MRYIFLEPKKKCSIQFFFCLTTDNPHLLDDQKQFVRQPLSQEPLAKILSQDYTPGMTSN